MSVPYFRWRIVWLHLHGRRAAEIAQTLSISERTVRRCLAKSQHSGDVKPLAHKNGPEKLLSLFELLEILKLLSETPSTYLKEIKQKLYGALKYMGYIPDR